MYARSSRELIGTAVMAAVLLVSCSAGESARSGELSAAVVPQPIATPSSHATAFIAALGGRVRSVGTPVVEGMGDRTCAAFAEGASAADIRGILVQKGLHDAEASRVLLAAVSTLCPEFGHHAMG
jgi:hypothetical protein